MTPSSSAFWSIRSLAFRNNTSFIASRSRENAYEPSYRYCQQVTDVHEVSLLLPASVESARAARRAVDTLPLDEHQEAVFNLRLLITELIGNSINHAGLSTDDSITLRLQLRRA